MFPASWNVGAVPPGGAHNTWGYHGGTNGSWHGNGYDHVRRGIGSGYYPYTVFPVFVDPGSYYGYSDEPAAAPPPQEAPPNYSEGVPYSPHYPVAPPEQVPQQEYHPQAESTPYQPVRPQPVIVEPPQPPITIVLQNGKQLVVQNYAVMNGMLWDFTKAITLKIPLSSIDLSASARATNAAGVEFPELTPSVQ
jgi:hypothetical protein